MSWSRPDFQPGDNIRTNCASMFDFAYGVDKLNELSTSVKLVDLVGLDGNPFDAVRGQVVFEFADGTQGSGHWTLFGRAQ